MKKYLCNTQVKGLVTMAAKILGRQSLTQLKDNPSYLLK